MDFLVSLPFERELGESRLRAATAAEFSEHVQTKQSRPVVSGKTEKDSRYPSQWMLSNFFQLK